MSLYHQRPILRVDIEEQVLKTAVKKGGDLNALPENYLLRFRKKGAYCPRCGNRIVQGKSSGRTGYFCPVCQKSNQA